MPPPAVRNRQMYSIGCARPEQEHGRKPLARDFNMEEKRVALKMIIDGKEKDISFEELALSNNLAQEALVRVLIDKKLITPKELLEMMETVKKERYRHIEDK